MSFGFRVGDLVAGTELARRAITALRELQDSEKILDSTIVLSFRALQARRISELQEELLQLSMQKMGLIDMDGPQEVILVINDIDLKLNNYGSRPPPRVPFLL
jgi:hypothetical protein